VFNKDATSIAVALAPNKVMASKNN